MNLCTDPAVTNQSDDADLAAITTLAIDQLATLLGLHASAETDFAGALNIADFVRIMHNSKLRSMSAVVYRQSTATRISRIF